MKPTPAMIAKILDNMSDAAVNFDPDDLCDQQQLWWATCLDPSGRHRADGSGETPQEAIAAAWVNTFLPPCRPGEEFEPITAEDRATVPIFIPDDWTFTIDDFPTSGTA